MLAKYRAPWSTTLIVISALIAAICVLIAGQIFYKISGAIAWTGLLPIAIVCGSALFTIRGYSVTPHEIQVQRLLWKTHLSLADLQSAQYLPNAMSKSIRTCGNGGLFSFSGFFRNKLLGSYRALATDLRRTVVLRFASRTIVISPDKPEQFVLQINNLCQNR
jgi:hypothetical protein